MISEQIFTKLGMRIEALEVIYFRYFLIPNQGLYQQDGRTISEMDGTLFHVIGRQYGVVTTDL